MTPLIRNAVTLRRCQAARSSRTTTATLVAKSVTAIARRVPGTGAGVLNDLAVSRGRPRSGPA